ncbi:hypothetical protein Avbf_03734 [Armadillidium vulgare]|nr:hypothetical protein Avbf_03734 [Armadillidium vulgare]
MSVLLIGDSHLEQCHIAAQKITSDIDFGYDSLKVTWHYQKNQIKLALKFYKENITNKETPDVVVIMCGGHDIVNGNTPVDIANMMKGFVNYLNGLPVKYIIVCSIIEIKRQTNSETNDTNKIVRNTNKTLAKIFKNMNKVIFVNVRPPGDVRLMISEDKFHLKPEGYQHIIKRILATLEERVLLNLQHVSKKAVRMQVDGTSNEDDKGSNFKKNCNIESRMNEFRKILLNDYKRICITENDLTERFNKVEQQLQNVSKEKNEIISVYKKLFDLDITEEN